jgi:hypothetical protein
MFLEYQVFATKVAIEFILFTSVTGQSGLLRQQPIISSCQGRGWTAMVCNRPVRFVEKTANKFLVSGERVDCHGL